MSPLVYIAGIMYLTAVIWRVHGFMFLAYFSAGLAIMDLVLAVIMR